jgi:hypothetical protein
MKLLFTSDELEKLGADMVNTLQAHGIAFCVLTETCEPLVTHNAADRPVLAKLDSEGREGARVLTTPTHGLFIQADWATLYRATDATHWGRP